VPTYIEVWNGFYDPISQVTVSGKIVCRLPLHDHEPLFGVLTIILDSGVGPQAQLYRYGSTSIQ